MKFYGCTLLLMGAFVGLAVAGHLARPVPLAIFFALLAVAWIAYGGAWKFSATLSPRRMQTVLWTGAIFLRLCGLMTMPILEDDFYRYLWDGRVLALTGNPYGKPPEQFFADPQLGPVFEGVLDNINHPDVPTIYGPVCQYAFALSYWVAPGQVWPWKLILVGADALVLALLVSAVGGRRALLYAWSPLLVFETAFNAHPELLAVALATSGLLIRSRAAAAAAACLGLAVAAKLIALLILPFALWSMPKRNWLIAGLAAMACYLPFWCQGSPGELSALATFLRDWEFNSTVFAAVSALGGPRMARLVCAAAFLGFYAVYFQRWRRRPGAPWPRGDWVYGCFFLLSAVVNPWYLIWLVPFLAIYPSLTVGVAGAAVFLSYAHGLWLGSGGLAPYEHPVWVRPLELGLIALALIWQNAKAGRGPRAF